MALGSVVALALASSSAGCATEVGARSQPITDGALAPDDHAVVALLRDGHVACTGTLIAPLVVITARHCIPDPAGAVEIGFGADPTIAETRAARVHWLPSSVRHDVGLILLDAPAPSGVEPVPLFRGELGAAQLGAPIRVVGFGGLAADDTTAPLRRTGTARISAVEAFAFRYVPDPNQPCLGDSGGPVLFSDGAAESLIGVVSSGDPACVEGGSNARLDLLVESFIDPFIAASTPGVAGVGELCFGDDTCAIGTCFQPADTPTRGYCTLACEDDAGCPSAMRCEDESCRYPLPSPGAPGSDCADDLDCASRLCRAPAADPEALQCTSYCAAGIDACGETLACEPVHEQEGVSACFAPSGDGGCSLRAGGAPAGSPWAWLALAAGAVVRRRRRR